MEGQSERRRRKIFHVHSPYYQPPCNTKPKRRLREIMKLKNLCILLLVAVIAIGAVGSVAQADTAKVAIQEPWYGCSYTVQIWRNGTLVQQNTNVTLLTPGYRNVIFYNIPSGCGYIADAWMNGVGVHSHTWPSTCVSGTTQIGCLQFDGLGEPSPWIGSCP